MALELKQSVSLAQQLVMTPQLQQAIKLLQLSRLELLETITQEMEQNPVLEEQLADEADEETAAEEEPEENSGEEAALAEVTVEETPREDIDWDTYFSEYETRDPQAPAEDRDELPFENVSASRVSLAEHLLWQLGMSHLDEAQRAIALYLIGNLNEDGYLETSIEETAAATGYPVEQVRETLSVIQNLDPVGVAARDMRECLLIQVRFQKLDGTLLERIIQDHLEDLENKRYPQIIKTLGVTQADLTHAITLLQQPDPRPGRNFGGEETVYVVPDIYVVKTADGYEVIPNEDGLPKLRVNTYYREILKSKDPLGDEAKSYIQDKLRSAAWLIKSIQQRQRTIYRVTLSIFQFQHDFLERGVSGLKPLVLRDVAADLNLHESTISRVTSNKYVHTPQGIYELKFFFSSGIHGADGDMLASESVKDAIRQIIRDEDKRAPHSDQDISDLLKTSGTLVARRTVAKYREMIGILPARKRRELK